MSDDKLTIVKSHDDWRYVVEIKQTAKGDPQVMVKARDDDNVTSAGDLAIAEYIRVCKKVGITK